MYVRIKTYSYFYPNSIDAFFQGFNSQKGALVRMMARVRRHEIH